MTTIAEENQRFEFGDGWAVFRYDCEEAGYHAIHHAVSGAKSCDFIGLHGEDVFLIEVKDFRGYRIQNKKRLGTGELAQEVANKATDTLAGIVSGCRRSDTDRPWMRVAKALTNPGVALRVALCLEDDSSRDARKWKQQLDTQTKLLQAKLRWLRADAIAYSREGGAYLPNVQVADLPGAAGHVVSQDAGPTN